jgi:hypothetical protein
MSRDLGVVARTDVEGMLAATMLAVEGRELTGRDLLAGGVVSGRWQQLERELSEGLGLLAAQSPPRADISEEVHAFRFERQLLSAEDMRAWLHARRLVMSDVNGVAARQVARRRGSGAPDAAAAAAEVAAALPAEAICSGAARELGWWLADRLLSTKATAASVEPIAPEDPRIMRLALAEARTVAGARSGESGPDRAERLAWIAALDDAHRRWEASVTGTREIARRLHERELDWCRFGLDELRLTSPGAAAEAGRQLAEGGDPQHVAAAAGVPITDHRVVLADAAPQLARVLVGAVVGDVAGPWSDDGEQVVARVRERRPPNDEDQPLLARARAELLSEAAERLRAGKVRWHDRA